MSLLAPIIAPFKGLELCLTNPEVRKFAIKPWLIGAASYFLVAPAAIYSHSYLTASISPAGNSFIANLISFFAWLGVAFGLLLGTIVFTFSIVLIAGSYFHSQIARFILNASGKLPADQTLLSEIARTGVTEALKLFWLIPLFLITFILGLIPFFTPVAFVLGSLLLSYQFFDYPLDSLQQGAFRRFAFLMRHVFSATLFGATLIALGTIPFVALFLPPIAVAGAAWLFIEMNWVKMQHS